MSNNMTTMQIAMLHVDGMSSTFDGAFTGIDKQETLVSLYSLMADWHLIAEKLRDDCLNHRSRASCSACSYRPECASIFKDAIPNRLNDQDILTMFLNDQDILTMFLKGVK